MMCAVFGCKNCNNKGSNNLSYFSFPRDKRLLKKWISFCRRKDKISVSGARLCSQHFTKDDFANDMQFEMGLATRRLLHADAYPTIHTNAPFIPTDREIRLDRERKEYLATVFNEAPEEVDVAPDTKEKPMERVRERKEVDLIEIKEEISKEIYKENITNKNEQKYIQEINVLKRKLLKAQSDLNNLEQNLAKIFTKGQIKKLTNGDKRQLWTKEDIVQSIELYSSSPKTYQLLRRKEFPLPAIRTLQKWAKLCRNLPRELGYDTATENSA